MKLRLLAQSPRHPAQALVVGVVLLDHCQKTQELALLLVLEELYQEPTSLCAGDRSERLLAVFLCNRPHVQPETPTSVPSVEFVSVEVSNEEFSCEGIIVAKLQDGKGVLCQAFG